MTIAWVTGGGTGIGRALAKALVHQGARVVISGRRREILEQTAQELGGEILPVSGDASEAGHAPAVAEAVQQRWGKINLLINNAGSNSNHSFLNTTPEEYLEALENNCLSAIRATAVVLPGMRATGKGAIVNISSIYGRWASASSASYSVSKYALAGYTDALRQGLVGTGIQVLGVYPGFIRTDMTSPFVRSGSLRSRMGKSPEQMAEAVLRALKRHKGDLYFPWYVPWVLRFARWMPRLANRTASKFRN